MIETNTSDNSKPSGNGENDVFASIQQFLNSEQAKPYDAPQQQMRAPTPQLRQVNSNGLRTNPVSNQEPSIPPTIHAHEIPQTSVMAPIQVVEKSSSVLQRARNMEDKVPPNMDRRSKNQEKLRAIGNVTCCSGTKVVIATLANTLSLSDETAWAVGQMVSIVTNYGRIVALVREMRTELQYWDDLGANTVIVEADIVGEINDDGSGVIFKRGVTKYPGVGAMVHKIRSKDLEAIYDLGNRKGVKIGSLSQNSEINAMVGVDDILRRHAAILGTTGVGKSCAVSLIISRALECEPNLRVVMLDPHNEFGTAFGDKSTTLDQTNLTLPYWLLNFDELEDVVFRGKPNIQESDILRELVVVCKNERRTQLIDAGMKDVDPGVINVDSPVPYRMLDVIKHIDDILGQLEPRFDRYDLRSLRVRIELLENNQRYNFMFQRGAREENYAAIISKIFRIPSHGKPITTVNLSGLPSEVMNAVASVIARLSFDVARASRDAMRVLLVCEEAHRYVPRDKDLGFGPTRMAISRIAKEGRKYGCAIAIVTQRPGELDQTILSQCSTIFTLRLTNEHDQEIIRSALSDSSASVTNFISSLDNREAIAFGEGVAVPMRLRFDDYDLAAMKAQSEYGKEAMPSLNADQIDPRMLINNMRGLIDHTIFNAPENQASPKQGSPQNPIRPGLTRPNLLKRDIAEILGAKDNEPKKPSLVSPGLIRKS